LTTTARWSARRSPYARRHIGSECGHDLYTWCGFDALFLPIVLGERAEVAWTCPVTGEAIHLTVEADGTISGAEPPGVVVGIVGPQVMDDPTRCGSSWRHTTSTPASWRPSSAADPTRRK
jgi:hypothetical protein